MDNWEKKGKAHQGTCIKDSWTKTIRGEGRLSVGGVGG